MQILAGLALACGVLIATEAAAQDLRRARTPEPSARPVRTLLAETETRAADLPAAETESATDAPQPQPADFATRLAIDGVKGKLEAELKSVSLLEAKADDPPSSRAALIRRAEEDQDRFAAALKAEGYYAYTIAHRITFEEQPVRVTFTIDPGPQYTLAAFDLIYDQPENPGLMTAPSFVGVAVGGPALTKPIVDAPPAIIRLLGESGYPLAKIKDQSAAVDHGDRTMRVRLAISEGPRVVFGETRVTGLDGVDLDYVVRVANLNPGEHFNVRRIDEARRRLFATGLFEGIEIKWADAAGDADHLDVLIDVVERERRTVSLGANYSTTEGLGADIEWTHRNLLGQDEDLTFTLRAAELEQSLRAELAAPNFSRLDQRVYVAAEGVREDVEAYEERRLLAEAGLSRPLGGNWLGGGGGELSLVETQEDGLTKTNVVVALPIFATYDGSDNLFNPTEGFRLDFRVAPAAVTLENTDFFTMLTAGGSIYQKLTDDDTLVAAARAKAGVILGPARDKLPAGRRLYAGGGGSIRGYEFQSAGPLDSGGDPEGGRSLAEFGVELRWKVTEDIGIVPFIDGGAAFADPVPDFQDLQFAAGLGFRYYTPVGPLRLDIAVPLNPRETDNLFEFYISLGQAF